MNSSKSDNHSVTPAIKKCKRLWYNSPANIVSEVQQIAK